MRTVKSNTVLYSIRFDGSILTYKVRRPFGWLLKKLGFAAQLEMPLNIVLKYSLKPRIGVFVVLQLTIDRFKFGLEKPNPARLLPIIILACDRRVIRSVVADLERNL